MSLGEMHRHAFTHAGRLSLTVGVVVGLGLALTPGPATGAGGGSGPGRDGGTGPAAAPTTLARTDAGLTVESLAVPAADAAARSAGAAAELPATRVRPFGLVGVTWQAGSTPAGTTVQVRLHQAGDWTGWQQLDHEASEGPAANEDPDAREGTGPLWTGGADGVAVRVTSDSGVAPADVQVVTVDPGAGPSARGGAPGRPDTGDPIVRPPSFPHQPHVISRKRWGADPSLTDPCDSPRYGRTAKMVFVHHTVNANDYTPRESPAIVRAIYAYHTQGQHWCDIGYNALVDRFGNIYEGRRGGLRKPVRGAHAGDYNTGTVGVSLIGNFEVARPSARMKNALVRFIGWRLGTSYQPVRGMVRVNGARFDRISGHRDAMPTACPGRYVYAQLPTIRKRVADYLGRYHSTLERKADSLGLARTGPVWKGERVLRGGYRTQFHAGWMFGKKGFGAHLLVGRVLHRYLVTGGPAGRLGWPKSDVRQSPTPRVRVLEAQRGRLYARGPRWVKVVFGPIFQRYRSMGFADSRLGLPATNVVDTRRGQRARFQHGVIVWDKRTDRTRVKYT